MNYEVTKSEGYVEEWRAEAMDNEGRVFVAIFSGPGAKERANEYAVWKNFLPSRRRLMSAAK